MLTIPPVIREVYETIQQTYVSEDDPDKHGTVWFVKQNPVVLTPNKFCNVCSRAVVKSTFAESKTSPSPKRFESESRPSPKRFESESKEVRVQVQVQVQMRRSKQRMKKIFFKTTYLIIDNLCDTRDGISSILI